MKGTERQIEWAEKIRNKKLPVLEVKVAGEIEYLKNAGLSERVRDEAVTRLNKNMEFIRSNDSAAWWIENRDGLSLAELKSMDIE